MHAGTPKQVSNDPVAVDQRMKQLDKRRAQYQWKPYPDSGLPSSYDDAIDFPTDEAFHRVKEENFLINAFQGIYFNGVAVAATLAAVDKVIQTALGVKTSTFKNANDLYLFEQLPQRLLNRQIENRGDDPAEQTKECGPGMLVSQAHRWITDEEFGRQILNGVNPVLIRRCTALPDNFPVTEDMVKDLLVRNKSLKQEMKVC